MNNFDYEQFKALPLPSEDEITAAWTGSKPVVSIVTITYNHAAYIEDAIRGFLLQKTNFPFEIIIQDDVSTDDNRRIISDYAERYPKLIKKVFLAENLYSKNTRVMFYAARNAVGDYLAMCEGDDYWIDRDKLQIQVDALQAYPDCEITFHSAVRTVAGVPDKKLFCKVADGNTLVDVGPIIRNGGSYMPTAAMLIRRSFFDRAFADTTGFYEKYLTAFYYHIMASIAGGALYIDRPMCVYRNFAEGSWTEKVNSNPEFYKRWASNYLNAMYEADALTGHRYAEDFAVSIKRCHLSVLNSAMLDLDFRENYFQEHKNELGLFGKLLWLTVLKWPVPHALFKRLRAMLR